MSNEETITQIYQTLIESGVDVEYKSAIKDDWKIADYLKAYHPESEYPKTIVRKPFDVSVVGNEQYALRIRPRLNHVHANTREMKLPNWLVLKSAKNALWYTHEHKCVWPKKSANDSKKHVIEFGGIGNYEILGVFDEAPDAVLKWAEMNEIPILGSESAKE